MKSDSNMEYLITHQESNKGKKKEVKIEALLTVGKILGWKKKTVTHTGENLAELLKRIATNGGMTLYDVLIQEDGAVRPEYIIWLNDKPIKQAPTVSTSLQSGDKIVVMRMNLICGGG